MTNNSQLPISKVRSFAEQAEQRGCYTKSQRGNLETAWTIFLKSLSDQEHSGESDTVEHILPLVETVFREYGSENPVSLATVRAYQTRVKRLLGDFVDHNGGDFMTWKESLNRANVATAKSRSRHKRPIQVEPEEQKPDSLLTAKIVSHRLVLSRNREGTLLLPADLSETDVEPVWQQLEALKTLIKAQIAATQDGQGG